MNKSKENVNQFDINRIEERESFLSPFTHLEEKNNEQK